MARYRPKRHQQPSWSLKAGLYTDLPIEPSRWDKFLISENIAEQDVRNNPKVLKFVLENAEKFYVPEKVLKMCGVMVDG